jgi:hypothetical protein
MKFFYQSLLAAAFETLPLRAWRIRKASFENARRFQNSPKNNHSGGRSPRFTQKPRRLEQVRIIFS